MSGCVCEYSLRSHSITSNWKKKKKGFMAYISLENLFLQVTRYGHMDTSKDWNCIDKILPFPIRKANGADDEVTHSDWMASRQKATGINLKF